MTLSIYWDKLPKDKRARFCLQARALGAPNLDEYKMRLTAFMQGENIAYIYNAQCVDFPNTPEAEAVQIATMQVLQSIDSKLGVYEDGMVGIKNMFANMARMLQAPDISHAEAKFEHAILVAAGPSLDLEMQTLKDAYDSEAYLFVACDVTIRKLQQAGIYPHILVTTERYPGPEEFINVDAIGATALVAPPVAATGSIGAWNGRLAFVKPRAPHLDWLPFPQRKPIRTGVSVAPTALAIINLLNIRDIALVGQDLCYHPATWQTHANLHTPGRDAMWKPGNVQDIIKDTHNVEGNTTSRVRTTTWWSNFAGDIVNIASDNRMRVTNTSKLGRKLPGIPFEPLQTWMRGRGHKRGTFHLPATNANIRAEGEALIERTKEALSTLRTMRFDKRQSVRIIMMTPHFKELASAALTREWVEIQNYIHRMPLERAPLEQAFREAAQRCRDDIVDTIMGKR